MKKHNTLEYFILFFTISLITVSFAADQLKKTVCSSGCDYTTLNAAITAQQQDLVSNDKYLDIEIQEAFDDTEPVDITSYTTDADHYINIYTDATARHDGTTGSGYAIYPGAGNGNCITLSDSDYVYINGLEFKLEGTGYNQDQTAVATAASKNGVLYFSDNLVWAVENSGTYTKLKGLTKGYSGNPTWYVWNNVIAGLTGTTDNEGMGIEIANAGSGTYYLYNNTISEITGGNDDSIGIRQNVGTIYAKNNIVIGCDLDYSGTFHTDSSHNLSSDDSVPPQGTYYSEKTVTFVDSANGDYSVGVGETDVVEKGKFLGNDSNLDFLDDIVGLTRGGTWDVGAFQYATTDYIPITTDFQILEIGDISRNLTVDIYQWDTYIQSGSIDEYCLTESAETPELGDDCWEVSEPTQWTFSGSGEKTLYTWLKSDGDELSAQASDTINIKPLTGYTSAVWSNNGEDKVRRDEVRELDDIIYSDGSTDNVIWDGTTIQIKEGKNGFAQFSVYIEAGESNLTGITIEMSDLVSGGNTIDYTARATDDLFDFTQTDIEVFYVRYLQVLGLRGAETYGVTGFPENRWEESLQRPNTPTWEDSTVYTPGYYKSYADNGTTWYDRPGADKYYPDILVPIELEPTFNITAGESQQIWVDIWLDKNVVAGDYTGNFVVKDDGVTIYTTPVELEVYNFTLPDSHYMKTWGYFEWTNYINRYFQAWYPNYSALSSADKQRAVDVWKNTMFMLRRHGSIYYSGTEASDCNITDVVPATDYRDLYNILNGTLFNATDGYDGPDIEGEQEIFIIGTYGRWNAALYPDKTATFTGSGLDDFSLVNKWSSAGDYVATQVDYKVEIDGTGTPDTFKWSDDGGSTWDETTVAITGETQDLDGDSTITFGATTGHTSGDYWTYSSLGETEAEGILQDAMDTCYTNLEALNTGIRKMLWLSDEPWTEEAYDAINTYAQWAHGATGGGENVLMYATGSVESSIDFEADDIDVNIKRPGRRDWWNRPDEDGDPAYVKGWKYYEDIWLADGKEMQVYSGPWDLAAGRSLTGWQNYRDGIEWNLLWHMNLWTNNEGGTYYWGEDTRLFVQASTLGTTSPPSIFDTVYGIETYSNGNGVLLYPGTDRIGKLFTFTGSSGTQDQPNFYCDDGEGQTAYCTFLDEDAGTVWISHHEAQVDDFENGDTVTSGSWSATLSNGGTNVDNYEIDGPIASIRLKAYRKTIQDYDYLSMAALNCSTCVDTIVDGTGIINTHYKVMSWDNTGYGGTGNANHEAVEVYGDYDYFERAREELANIILGTNPPSKFKGSLNGFSK